MSILVLTTGGTIDKVAMNGTIFPADRVRKNRQAGKFECLAD